MNHINGNKLDFSIENLEWATASENRIHALSIGLAKPPFVPTKVINICSGEEYGSISEAAEFYKIKYITCKRMLKGLEVNDTCLRLAS